MSLQSYKLPVKLVAENSNGIDLRLSDVCCTNTIVLHKLIDVNIIVFNIFSISTRDKLGYTDKYYSDISTKFQEADDALFRSILSNTSHVLHTFLSERPETTCSLRTRSHNINYSFRKLTTLTIDTLSLGLSTKTYTGMI